jgi:putative transposase
MNRRNSKESIEERKNPYIRHGRQCVFLLHVHLVFVTKYRHVCFTDRVLKHLEEIFRDIAIDFEATLETFEGEGDHVHLLINYPPKISPSKLVNSLKGVSSRHIRNANYPEIRKKLWGNALWSPSYFAGSCGGATLDVVKEYIEQQDRPV